MRAQSSKVGRLWFWGHFSLSCIGEGNGNPLQCSCVENPRDGGTWWAAARCSPRGNPACRGTFGGRRKAVRGRHLPLQLQTAARPCSNHHSIKRQKLSRTVKDRGIGPVTPGPPVLEAGLVTWLSLAFTQASLCPHAWNVVLPSSPSHLFLEMQFGSHPVTELDPMDPTFGPAPRGGARPGSRVTGGD